MKPGQPTPAKDDSERSRQEQILHFRVMLWEAAATHSIEEVIRMALDRIGVFTGSPIGFYHFVEPGETTLSLQAWSTQTTEQFCTAEGQGRHYPIEQAGVWADCVRERRPVIHNDYASLPHRKGMPPGHAAVIRELVVPVMRGQRVVAVAGVGNKPTDYTDDDLAIVGFLADVAWEVIARQRADEALRARVRQLHCLYSIADVIEKNASLEAILQQTVDLIPSAWCHLELPCARITLGDQEFRTASFRDTQWGLAVDLVVEGETTGVVELRCQQQMPDRAEGPFGQQDRDLIEEIAARMAKVVQRYRAEAALRRSEERYRASEEKARRRAEEVEKLMDMVPAGIWVAQDAECRSIIGNKAAQRMYEEADGGRHSAGTIRGEVLNTDRRWYKDGRELKPDELPMQVAVARGEDIPEYEMDAVLPSGRMITMFGSASPLFDEQGKVRGCLGVYMDVTRLKQVEQALRESEAKFRSLFENMRDAYAYCEMLFDEQERPADFRYLAVNEAFARLTGLDDVVGKRVGEVLPGIRESSPEMFDAFGRVAVTGQPERFEIYLPVMGKWFAISVYCPKSNHFVAVFDNISARKTAELERERLVEALRQIDREKNGFLAVLSHELRNPLAPISNSLFILEHAERGGEQARRAEAVINRQFEQLVRLVDDLLDVTRISRNKIELQRARLELNELVRQTVDDHRAAFDKSRISLELAVAPQPVLIDGDRNRLAQVIGNLLQNAVKFTPAQGRVKVEIASEPALGRVEIRVSDTGEGIAPEVLSTLFRPFVQADGARDRSRGGLGLGLALIKGLVELHGGEVSATSAGLGQGTEVLVRLPLAPADVTQPAPVGPGIQSRPRRVLIIDDNVDGSDSLADVLTLSDHVVAVAYDGPEGLAKARTFRPEIVLCDIGLPGMDGYEVAKALRADPELQLTRLVALSGYAQLEDVARAHQAGFDTHLAKPANLDKLREVLACAPALRR